MIEGFLIAIGVLGCGIVYHIMNKHIKKSEDRAVKAEADALVAKGYKENAEQHVITLQKNHAEFVEMIKAEMSYKINELEEQYKKHAEDRIQKVINDYEEALKLETESLEQQVAELDEQLGIKIQEITLKNIMYFTCTCDRTKHIPCSIDLSSDENYFTCPECGAVYRVVINASTILQSGITNNHKLATMFDGVEVGEIDKTSL